MPEKDKSNRMAIFLPALAALVFICVFTYWQFGITYEHLPLRIPGEDGAPKKIVNKVDKSIEANSGVSTIVKNEKNEEELVSGINTDAAAGKLVVIRTMPEGASLEKGSGKPSQTKDSWPCFRGVRRDAIANDSTEISRVWPESGPPVVWELELGQGYAGAAVRDGRVYIFDYDEVKKRDVIRCLSFDKGEEIWSYSYPMDIKRNHGISRTVVALDGKFLIGIGPKCQVTCLNSDTGAFIWRMDLVEQLGTAVPGWYAGQCPLIEDGKLILAPGAPEVLLTAIDCASGAVIWKTPNPHGSKMSHASVVPMLYKGKQTYIYAGTNGVVGVSATDGAIIWETREFKWHTIAPSPVPVGEDRVLFTAGYGGDAKLAQLVEVDGKVQAKIIKIAKPREFGSEQHTPIFYKGFIYAVLPKPRQELVCMDTDLNEVWASGSPNRFGLGPYMIAGGLIFLMNDDGVLTMAEASEKGYVQLAQAKVLPGPDSWGPMVFVDGKLIIRDLNKMKCLDLGRTKREIQ